MIRFALESRSVGSSAARSHRKREPRKASRQPRPRGTVRTKILRVPNILNNSFSKFAPPRSNKMKNYKNLSLILTLLAAASVAPDVSGQSNPVRPSSAKSSRISAIPAQNERPTAEITAACSAAADELLETRRLVEALDFENAALVKRLETEREISSLLKKAGDAREAEAAALRSALAAKEETIAAKEAVIENRQQMIEVLKKKSNSPLRRIADLLIGAAVFAVLK